uniref:Uncharacterized protein n=1 Tax=Anopheles christyi TaxID=43041 RepID=A0A182JZM7_9DIPT
MLQAMTDAPADPNSSDSEGCPSVKLPQGSGTDIRYSPYPYPPQPYYCCPNPNWHYYDPTTLTNPQYYPPHHPPPHAPGYYYPPLPPPPPGHYDRGGGFYGGYMSPHHFYYAPEPCSPCTPPPYYQLGQPQTAYCEPMPSEAIHTYVITTPPPRIVVTPTPDDSCSDSELQAIKEQLGELRDVPGEFAGVEPNDYCGPIPLTRSQSSLKRLSERLTNFSNGECPMEGGSQSAVRCSPCSPLNERYRTYEESTSSVPSSQSEASDSEDEGPVKPKAVGRTQTHSNGHVKEKTPEKKKQVMDDEESEEEEDEEEDEGESEDEETVGYGPNGAPPVEEHLPHQLSVIFEEESVYGQSTVASRRTSVCSNSSTLSDCSSTLANDLDDDKDENGQPSGNRTDDDIDRLDDTDMVDKSLVSVRLPLKLSFSKSPNNEDIATLVVGESEITGSKEKLPGVNRCSAQAPEEDSGEESDTEEDDSEEEIEESSGEETETDGEDNMSDQKTVKANSGSEEQSNDADTDVTVTITIPSLSSKAKSIELDSVHRPDAAKDLTPAKTPFKIDYEEESEVSVSVSLPLKPKGGSSSDIAKQSEEGAPTSEPKAHNENGDGGEEEEEVDFWSQIGDEDDYQRPVRSYSRDMWSSREVSVDRQSVWSQDAEEEEDEEASTTATTDFWSAENGPTEASDLWSFGKRNSPSAVPASSGDSKGEKIEDESKDSLDYWHKENERLVKVLYERRASEVVASDREISSCGIAKDENNNKACVAQQKNIAGEGMKTTQSDRKTEDHSEEEEDGSDSESDNDSEEYETSNTSKEDSEAEHDVGETLPKQVESTKKPKEDVPQVVSGGTGAMSKDAKLPIADDASASAMDKIERDKKLSVKERISLFETQAVSVPSLEVTPNGRGTVSTPTMGSRLRPLSRQKQFCEESEAEDDSGVTSDMSKHISEVETDSECFPEMRKMTRYQRAATHSRLFKLLQDESNNGDSEEDEEKEEAVEDGGNKEHERTSGKTLHVAATREEHDTERHKAINAVANGRASKVTPQENGNSETNGNNGTEIRRDRLTLPISHQSSSGNDSLSSSTSSASPVSGALHNEKLAEELVQSLLMKKKGRLFRNLPLEKLHAAALKILQEDLESNGTISSTEDNMATVDSTPALTPQEFKSEYPTSYADYYDTWCSDSMQPNGCHSDTGSDCGMVKMFRTVPEHQLALAKKDSRLGNNGHWSPRCPRVFSNKNVPRLMGVREGMVDGVEPSRGSRPPSRASSNRSPYTVITPSAGSFYPMTGSPMDECPNRHAANRQFKLQ